MNNTAITVSGLNMYVKSVLSDDINLIGVLVKGEISNLSVYKSGHMYLTLKDEKSSVKAVMFAGNVKKLKFIPENGMNVVVRGRVSVYERDGVYQINIDEMSPDGLGALYLSYEQLKKRLQDEGLFDDEIKKPIKQFPKKIAVITSKTGAVINDIQNVLTRRYPIVELVLYPVTVQGEKAPKEIVEALILVSQRNDIDTVILARGGGSMEDLWCFNDEMVARAIAACHIPIISAIGHETDYTIADFVADLRAPTPSAAAELASANIFDVMNDIVYLSEKLDIHFQNILSENDKLLNSIKNLSVLSNPDALFGRYHDEINTMRDRLSESYSLFVDKKESRIASYVSVLPALNPLNILKKGFASVYKDDNPVRSAKDLKNGDKLKLNLFDGIVDVAVEKVKEY